MNRRILIGDAPPDSSPKGLTEKEQMVYQALLKRGASFMQACRECCPSNPSRNKAFPFGKGACICGQLCAGKAIGLISDKTRKATARQRVNTRVMALQCRPLDVVRPPGKKRRMGAVLTEAYSVQRNGGAWNVSWQDALQAPADSGIQQ